MITTVQRKEERLTGAPIHAEDKFILGWVERIFDGCSAESLELAMDAIEAHLLDRREYGIGCSECETEWIHSDGVSAKKMSLSPMSIVTGSIHKAETINTVSSGDVTIFTEDGPIAFKAGDTFVSSPGVRKMGITLTGVTFVNSFPNPDNIRDESKLQEMYFEPENAYDRSGEFDVFKRIAGIDQSSIDEYMRIAGEPVELDCNSIGVRDSDISGKGTIALRDIEKGERFPVFSDHGERTILARYSNHSFNPDLILVGSDGVAVRGVKSGEEITMNYLDNFIKTEGNGGLQCLRQ